MGTSPAGRQLMVRAHHCGSSDLRRRRRCEARVKTDTSEGGLEQLICVALTGGACDPVPIRPDVERETSAAVGGAGWICGSPNDYDREYTVDLVQLLAFLIET